MDLVPIIFGFSTLMLSMATSAGLLLHQAHASQLLSHQSKKFNCIAVETLFTNDANHSQIRFNGLDLKCMLPNIFKEDPDQEGQIDILFDHILRYCAENVCK